MLIAGALLLCSCRSAAEDDSPVVRVTVSAGSVARTNTVVSFDSVALPAPPGNRLVDEHGRTTALQQDLDGSYWFIIDSLAADEVRTYHLDMEREDEPISSASSSSAPDAAQTHALGVRAEAAVNSGTVRLTVSGEHVLSYHFEPTDPPRPEVDSIYRRGGYIHPVYTPSGVLVTDDYPPNHLHHHGIWAAWTNTRYEGRTPDFWNMGYGTGTVEPIGLDTSWSGPVHAGVRARNRYVDLTAHEPETVLLETWETRLFAPKDASYRLFDVRIVQVSAGDSVLHLPEYHYGGVGFRGHRQWDGPDGAVFLTSEGRTRADGHATRARWCHIGGRVDGTWAGIAIFDHPQNYRAPQPMRIHPDEPFFNFAPSQAGDWAIEPGRRYETRYRYVVYDGEPDPEMIERLWNDYAHPPVVTVEVE